MKNVKYNVTYTVSWISSDDQTQSALTAEVDSMEEAFEFANLKREDGELSVQILEQIQTQHTLC